MNRVTTRAERDELVPVRVWDLPVRLFHWGLVIAIAVSWLSGQAGNLDLHYASGLVVLWLVGFRLIWGVVGSPTARFANFVKGPAPALRYLRDALRSRSPSYSIGHNPAGACMVVALVLIAGLQAFTGLGNTDDVLFDGPLRDDLPDWTVSLMTSLHEPLSNVLLALIALHVAVIAAYRILKRENLVRAMITGDVLLPASKAGYLSKDPMGRTRTMLSAMICALVAAAPPAAIHWLN